jgi:hypothetical protein
MFTIVITTTSTGIEVIVPVTKFKPLTKIVAPSGRVYTILGFSDKKVLLQDAVGKQYKKELNRVEGRWQLVRNLALTI